MNLQPAPRVGTRPAPLLLAVSALLLFLGIRDSMLLADSAAYGSTIASGHLIERSIHIGYYAVVWLLNRLLAPTHVPLDHLMIASNAVFMGLALLLAWRLFERLGATSAVASVATLTLLMTGNVLQQGSGAEVYALQLMIILAAQNLFFDQRYVAAGLVYGLAMLVSPLSIFACGPFLWQSVRIRDPRPLLKTAASSAVVYLPVLAYIWPEYLYGVRGLLTVGSKRVFGIPTLAYNALAIVQNFHWMVPFLLLGLLRPRSREREWHWLVVITVLVDLPLMLCLKEQGVFILPAYPFLALLAAGEVVRLLGQVPLVRSRALWLSLGAACVLTSWFLWVEPQDPRPREGLAQFLATVPDGSAIVADWVYAPAVPFYFRLWGMKGTLPHIVELEYATQGQIEQALHDYPNVYLIDGTQPPSRRSRLLRKTFLHSWQKSLSTVGLLHTVDPSIEMSLVVGNDAPLMIYRLSGKRPRGSHVP